MRAGGRPVGVVLSTGTCLVPPAPFSLADGDVVAVTVDAAWRAVTQLGVVPLAWTRMREALVSGGAPARRRPLSARRPPCIQPLAPRAGTRSHLGDRDWAWPSSFFLTTAMLADRTVEAVLASGSTTYPPTASAATAG